MKSSAWRQINWLSVIIHAVYVWIFGMGLAFFARLFGLDQARDFLPALTVAVALAVVVASYRIASRVGQQPLLHGLLVGLLVGAIGLVLNALTIGLTVMEVAGFMMQALGGLLGGRMAQRTLQGTQ